MKLIRLKIENWRGVEHREIEFDAGVTVIEGPNEVGKSSLFEALQLLFTELDSTAKGTVKAVQPAGQDLGSRVQAEFVTGPYHAVFTKQFNRQKATTLELYSPFRESIVGREAHERAVQMLEETMDVGLWRALQVTQGGEVSQALIKDSRGLAKALDAAAGERVEEGDSGLFERVAEEYQRYFTPRNATPRSGGEETRLEELGLRLSQLRGELKAAEGDLERHERLTRESAQLSADLPGQRARLEAVERKLRKIDDLTDRREAAQTLLQEAATRGEGLLREQERRQGLEQRIGQAERDVETSLALLTRCREGIDQQRAEYRKAREAHEAALKGHTGAAEREAESELVLTRAREQLELSRLRQLMRQLEAAEAEIQRAEARLARVAMTPEEYRRLEQSDSKWRHARAMLDMGSPELRVIACAEPIDVRIGDEPPGRLEAGGSLSFIASDDMILGIDRLARIEVHPGSSLSELQATEAGLRTDCARMMDEMGVADLAQAAVRRDETAAAEQALKSGRMRREELLTGTTREQLSRHLQQLESRLRQIPADRLPNLELAEQACRDARERVRRAAQELEARRSVVARVSEVRIRMEADEGILAGRFGSETQRREELARELGELRAGTTDAALAQAIRENEAIIEQRTAALNGLEDELRRHDPESLRLLHENARQVWQAANDRFTGVKESLAVLSDRLQRVQIDGLFEQLSRAESEFDAQRRRVQELRRRAAAARRLYVTLSRHRDAARRAYVAPLKKQIDTLGRLVFGPDFESELDDSLRFAARTLNGRVLPFEALSVGAREQIGILMRLAAARLVAADGGVPLILDDSLGFSDPQRLATMGAALAVAGRDAQVLILTCTPGRFQHVGGARFVRLEGS